MKALSLLLAALLASTSVVAAEPVKVDVFLDGKLTVHALLAGANARYTFSMTNSPDTTLELRLIAPEPLILDLKETTTGDKVLETTHRIKLVEPGSSIAVNDLKDAGFRFPYVLVRPE